MDTMLRAKTRLLLNHPFYAILLLKHTVVENTEIQTADVDGQTLRYNPEFFDKLSPDEQLGLLAHEILHTAFLHHLRRGGRDFRKWNEACDYAINQILVDSKIKLPKGALVDPLYRNKSAEEIYDLLPAPQGDGWEPGDGYDGGLGDVRDFPQADIAAQEAQQQENNLIEAMRATESAGSLPRGLKRLIQEILHPKVDWWTQLERLLAEISYDDYNGTRGDRNYLGRNLFIPSFESLKHGSLVFSVDTSGSITQEMLNKASAELMNIHFIVNNTLHVLYCDTEVQSEDIFEPGDDIVMNLIGGGGTDFIPPFVYTEEQDINPKMMIYFTDGYCNSFPPEPDYDVVWLCTSEHFNPPFGEVIYF